jgi:hypothetical protein
MLLARMGSSRIEPTVEALALRRDALKLRTVIQFVKVHRDDDAWRAILYLTLDHALPPNSSLPGGAAQSWKFSGDPGTLPYSYTLSPIPALLQGPSDGPLTRTFTVPATTKTPFPSLPLSLPNYVSYLHAVLTESRNAAHDNTAGLKRLAKMVDECFPEQEDDVDELDGLGRRRFRDRLKKMVGTKPKVKVGGNQDTYQIITPFMADDGH